MMTCPVLLRSHLIIDRIIEMLGIVRGKVDGLEDAL